MPYSMIIIHDQKIHTKYFVKYEDALESLAELLCEFRDEEVEFIIYRSDNNVILFTLNQRVKEGEQNEEDSNIIY